MRRMHLPVAAVALCLSLALPHTASAQAVTCKDGTTASQSGRGACSHHGGVASVAITVSWSDGVSVHTASVPCNAATGGPCTLTIGPAQGWQSGPHPVDQIEPVPYIPPSPSP